jgi:hypothetical protein
MTKSTQNTQHRVTDLHVAAFLMARGHQLVGLEEAGKPGQVAFVFASGQEDAPKFFLGERIEARAFAAAFKTLKAALHQRRGAVTGR